LDIEFSWITLGECQILGVFDQEGKGGEEKYKRTSGSTTAMGVDCRYRIACMFSSLVLAFMLFIGHDMSLAWRMVDIDCGVAYPYHFLDSHGYCGFISLFCFGCFSCFLRLG